MTALVLDLAAFLREHLPTERRASPHTCDTYAYCFQLLTCFAAGRLGIKPRQLEVEHLDARLVLAFLEHLERDRSNSARTRNAIPIGIRDVSVAEIGGERDEMACDGIGVVATPLKRANREGVAQVMDARTPLARLTSKSNGSCQAQEDGLHGVVAEHIACGRHEQCVSRRPKLCPHR